MIQVKATEKTTLILNTGWMPLRVVAARVAMSHMLCGRMKALDQFGNTHLGTWSSANSWFPSLPQSKEVDLPIFPDHQPCLKSAHTEWPIPFVGVTTSTFFYKPRAGKIPLSRLSSYYNNRCQICGEKTKLRNMTIEHVFPRSKGGPAESYNVLPTCKRCNSRKADIHPYFDADGVKVEEKIKKWPLILHVRDGEMKEEWKQFLFKQKDGKKIKLNAKSAANNRERKA